MSTPLKARKQCAGTVFFDAFSPIRPDWGAVKQEVLPQSSAVYFNFERRKNAETGHESLSILFRLTYNLLSVRDPGSLLVALGNALLTSLRPAVPHFAAEYLFELAPTQKCWNCPPVVVIIVCRVNWLWITFWWFLWGGCFRVCRRRVCLHRFAFLWQ